MERALPGSSIVLTSLLCATAAQAQYAGFGSQTRGALDCPQSYTTYHVTTLADSGAGSFRAAVSAGCRLVVFDVGGTITLASTLTIDQSYLTIDGTTAPPPGITFSIPFIRTAIEAHPSPGAAHDIVIHHLRMIGAGGDLESADIWELDGQDAAVYNVVLDHITAVSASDGTFDIWGEVSDITVSNNFVHDAVKTTHFSRPTPPNRERISIYSNVYARNNERQLRMRYDNRSIDIVNNVIYGWGWIEPGAAGLDLPSDAGYAPAINVEDNIYHYVSGLSGSADDAVHLNASTFPGAIYFAGNEFPNGEQDAVSTAGRTAIPAYAEVAHRATSELGDSVVPCVGTVYPTQAELDLLDEISLAVGGTGAACRRPEPPTNLQAE